MPFKNLFQNNYWVKYSIFWEKTFYKKYLVDFNILLH